MKSQPKINHTATQLDSTNEITKQDIINLATLKNITFTDVNYAKEHIAIKKKKIKTSYEIEISDVDGSKHQLIVEVKTYNK